MSQSSPRQRSSRAAIGSTIGHQGSTRGALVEIDFQEWIVAQGTNQGCIPAAQAVRQVAVALGAPVFSTRYLGTDLADSHTDPDAPENQFVAAMRPPSGAVILTKNGRNIFENPDLAANLDLRVIRALVVVGVLTDFGVRYTAETALDLGLQVGVVGAACSGTSDAAHQATLEDLRARGVLIIDWENHPNRITATGLREVLALLGPHAREAGDRDDRAR